MGVIIKRRTAVAVGREATYGTESSQLVNMGVQDITIDIQKTTILNNQMYARIEETRGSRVGAQMAQVTITGIAEASFLGQFYRAALGTIATATDTPEANAEQHTFTVLNTNEHPSYSLMYDDGNQDMAVLGSRLESLTTNVVAGDWVTYTAVFMGFAPVAASETASYADSHLFSADQATIRLAAVGGAFSGDGIPLTTFDLVISKNTESKQAFGSTQPYKILNKHFAVTGSMALLMENVTYRDFFRNHDLKSMQIVLSGGSIPSTATPTPFSVTVTLEQVHFDGWNDNGGADDIVEQTLTFRAEYEEASAASIMDIVLVNDQAGSVY